jgi:hypothetical protein
MPEDDPNHLPWRMILQHEHDRRSTHTTRWLVVLVSRTLTTISHLPATARRPLPRSRLDRAARSLAHRHPRSRDRTTITVLVTHQGSVACQYRMPDLYTKTCPEPPTRQRTSAQYHPAHRQRSHKVEVCSAVPRVPSSRTAAVTPRRNWSIVGAHGIQALTPATRSDLPPAVSPITRRQTTPHLSLPLSPPQVKSLDSQASKASTTHRLPTRANSPAQ